MVQFLQFYAAKQRSFDKGPRAVTSWPCSLWCSGAEFLRLRLEAWPARHSHRGPHGAGPSPRFPCRQTGWQSKSSILCAKLESSVRASWLLKWSKKVFEGSLAQCSPLSPLLLPRLAP